jgi:hypothetical protein
MVKEKKPKRDSNGKFASAQPNNPDCEPATKGFVKCIARTVHSSCIKNSHAKLSKRASSGDISFLAGMVACLFWLFMLSNHFEGSFTFTVGIAALVMIVIGLDVDNGMSGIDLEYQYPQEVPKSIQKYEAPKCEERKECE